MRNVLFACVASVCLGVALSAPSLVLTSPGPPTPVPENFSGNYEGKEGQENEEKADQQPIIYQFDINSNISNRFAKTLVTSKVKNPENKAKEAVFTVVLPEKAFISEFVMIIDGKSYKAYVKEKEEAKNIYDNAVQSGISAAHVAVSARDSNRFTVSLNIEPEAKATFLLTYEELLERKNNQYELVLNIHPGQVVKDLNIEVFVNESRPLKYVRTPSLRSGNEISKNDDSLNPSSDIQIVDRTSAVVRFKPDTDRQKGFAKGLGGKENEGLAGQFVLQYDVERDPQKGEVLLKDGYFVHFFAPEDLEPLPKHVVFVLDTSGSMYGTKLKQMKDAMSSILGELKESDTFHIVEFNTNIYVWNIDTENRIKVDITNEREPFEDLLKTELPSAVPASKEAVAKGKSVIAKLRDEGITNMLSSLETALHLVRMDLKKDPKHNQPIIIFLTDGEPTMGISDPEEITKIVTRHNTEKNQVPIFSLSFGDGADKNFLRKLSLKNLGFSRHIYEAADASLQLQEFYRQISSPLLSNIEFEYTDNVTEVSKKIFPIYFRGSELVVAGKYDEGFAPRNWQVRCGTFGGIKTMQSLPEAPVSSLERLWAYLTIKQKLEERDVAENKSVLTKQALDLALKYSFVTDVSSLVVVKPNATSAVDTEDASRPGPFADTARGGFGGALYAAPISAPSSFKQLSYTGFSRTSLRQFKRPLIMYDPPPQAVQSSGNLLVPQTKIYGPGYAAAGTLPYKCTDSVCTTPAAPFHFNAPTTVPVSPVPIPAPGSPLRTSLPWLSNVIHSNETISILGGEYELGENKFVMPSAECPKTPLNSTESGECNILSQCRQVHSYLTDFQTYEKFACIVDNRYAGVCCPKIMYMM